MDRRWNACIEATAPQPCWVILSTISTSGRKLPHSPPASIPQTKTAGKILKEDGPPLLRGHSECLLLFLPTVTYGGVTVGPGSNLPYRAGLLPRAAGTRARQEPGLLPRATVTPPYKGGVTAGPGSSPALCYCREEQHGTLRVPP